MPSKIHVRAVALVCFLSGLSPAFGRTAQTQQYIAPPTPMQEKWMAGLKEADQMLRAHQWEAAAKRGRKAGDEIVALAGTGESPAYTLAVVCVFRAIAEAELGHQEEAEWFWDSALNLFPDVAKTDLSPYGEKALALRQRTLRALEQKTPAETQAGTEKEGGYTFVGKSIERPRIVRQIRPEYPKALALLGSEGLVLVSSVIGEDGRPRQPVLLSAKGSGAGMRYVALDTIRQWRFEPAKLEGKPVAVNYVLTINFSQRKR